MENKRKQWIDCLEYGGANMYDEKGKTLSSITKIEKGKYRVVVNKFGQRKLQKDGYTLKYELEQTELIIEGKSNAKEYAELILNNQ